MKRIIRTTPVSEDDRTRYSGLRADIAADLPDLVDRHRKRTEAGTALAAVVGQLKSAREAKGLSVSDITAATGLDSLSLEGLEEGQRGDATVETLSRYADAVGKRLVVSLADN